MKFKSILAALFITTFSTASNAQSKVELEIKTGSDDLAHRDFQKDLEIRIIIDGKPDVVLLNANRGQNWSNNSTHKIKMNLDPETTAEQIKEIQLYRRVESWNNIEAGGADNWNLQKLVATATIIKDGNTLKYNLFNQQGTGGKALFRFVYENRNLPDDGQEKGLSKSFAITDPKLVSGTAALPTITLKATFKTGGDDLRGGGDNVDMVIKFRNSTVTTTLSNVNNNRNWRNFSNSSYQKILPPATNISNIESIELRHTGGGGIGADNWYLDKFKVSIVVNGVETVILDKIDTPIHYFTGDTRRKIFRL